MLAKKTANSLVAWTQIVIKKKNHTLTKNKDQFQCIFLPFRLLFYFKHTFIIKISISDNSMSDVSTS